MIPKTEAKIYLADQRGCSQKDWYRSYHTFNFNPYVNEHRSPFGNLSVLNDDTLKESCTINYRLQQGTVIFLLPVVGACDIKINSLGLHTSIDVGQCCILSVPEDCALEILNPYESELINYLYFQLTLDYPVHKIITRVDFDLDGTKNKLLPLFAASKENFKPDTIHLGKFNGRAEGTYTIGNDAKRIFVVVIEGAFEVNNRLLQARDGLALWNCDEVEFEALSNDAIMLVLEI